ncbi:unnamed protein product [Linum trigynum]|uniref:Uncharacterized protein n=1 Tax=Linum trigynum TaxID=586398 RepID=A0AAV2FJ87_9ROSI
MSSLGLSHSSRGLEISTTHSIRKAKGKSFLSDAASDTGPYSSTDNSHASSSRNSGLPFTEAENIKKKKKTNNLVVYLRPKN